jgi:pimeloyl-ACP methyl ester carboxylesterase
MGDCRRKTRRFHTMETDTVGPAPTITWAMPADLISWRRIKVDRRSATYGVGGEGAPVVLLRGWALGSRAYKRAVRRLIRRGCAVYTPAMPGFGGTADLPADRMTIGGYAAWVDAFMSEVAIDGAALVIGHSFGGGGDPAGAHLSRAGGLPRPLELCRRRHRLTHMAVGHRLLARVLPHLQGHRDNGCHA